MAASALRAAYDCVVLGSGRTARLLASSLEQAGISTLQLQRKPAVGLPAWLHPRAALFDGNEELGLSSLSAVTAFNPAGKVMASLHSGTSSRRTASGTKLPATAAAYSAPEGCELISAAAGEITIRGSHLRKSWRAKMIFAVETPAQSFASSAVGGVYRDVAVAPGEERHATLFATARPGEVGWLVPLKGGFTSLGLLRETAGEAPEESCAELLEEALVACPALTQRLIAAQLVGSLDAVPARQATPPAAAHSAWLSLPEYDTWLDPVFASGQWLAEELTQQIVALLTTPDATDEKLAAWQTTWPAVEQLTRERISSWYRFPASLSAALQDHAQREWYERLLAADVAPAASPRVPLSWEARALFTPRRAVTL
jgi:hypothetical protein